MTRELRFMGPPGTGKSTELGRRALQAANRYGSENILICSLTRAAGAQIMQEIRRQGVPIPDRAIGTLHHFALAALGNPAVVDGKDLNTWNEFVDGKGQPYFRLTGSRPDRDEAASENTWGGETLGDRCFEAYGVSRARMEPLQGQSELVQQFAELWEPWKEDLGKCDFTDMLEWAYRDTDYAPGRPDVLFMDEAQDTSLLGMHLLRKWSERASHLVIFGDPLQNLYAWAGTDPEAFTTPDVPDDQKRILAQSYRVPRQVHAYALAWIEPLKRALETQFGKSIEYFPRDAEGEVRRLGQAHWKYPEPAVQDAERYLSEGKTVMFQASCSHMLEPLIAVLRREGLPFWNPWRTKRGDWNPLARRNGVSASDRVLSYLRMCAEPWNEKHWRFWSAQDLWRWVEICEAKGLLQHGAKTEIQLAAKMAVGAEDELDVEQLSGWIATEAILAAIEGSETGDLTWWESQMLEKKRKPLEFPISIARSRGPQALREKPQIIVGTAHSLKGSEADVVYVWPDLSKAGMEEWIKPGEGHAGLLRLFYVAFTRARESLILCGQATPDAVSFH